MKKVKAIEIVKEMLYDHYGMHNDNEFRDRIVELLDEFIKEEQWQHWLKNEKR